MIPIPIAIAILFGCAFSVLAWLEIRSRRAINRELTIILSMVETLTRQLARDRIEASPAPEPEDTRPQFRRWR